MKSYQTLAVAGGALGILVAFAILLIVTVLGGLNDAFGGAPLEGKEYFDASMIVSIILYIIAIVLPFTIKSTRIVSGVLLGIGVITLVLISLYGVIGFALLIAAGIAALRYKKSPIDASTPSDSIQ